MRLEHIWEGETEGSEGSEGNGDRIRVQDGQLCHDENCWTLNEFGSWCEF